jgi:hypothetical protein
MGYANDFEKYKLVNDTMERIDVNQVSPETFIECYEKPSKPVVIVGVQRDWNATQKWTLHVSIFNYFNFHDKSLKF